MWKCLGLAIVIAVCILFISACGPAATPIVAPAATEAPTQAAAPTAALVPVPTEVPTTVVVTLTPAPPPTTAPAQQAPTAPATGEGARMTYPQPAEVILAGPSKSIPTVVAVALDEQIGLTRIAEPVGLGALDEKLQDWTMELYGVSDKSKPAGEGNDWARVGDVVSIAYKLEVLADPNYLVAADANPTPQVVFSPHHGGGSTYGGPNPGGTFEQQWAFGALPGIGPLPTPSCSADTKVFVFDTLSEDYGLFTEAAPPIPIPLPTPAPNATPCSTPNSHGLFVSSLIKQVAPGAQIELSPVLDACGAGTVWGMDVALVGILSNKPGPSVLNLSLGVQSVEPSCFVSDVAREIARRTCLRFWDDSKWLPVQVLNSCWLDTLLYIYRKQGGVIVAAAGNDSFANPAKPLQMQLPAAYDRVIGVVGSNGKGNRSCFSNLSKLPNSDFWVSAPAGEGDPTCAPAANLCSSTTPEPDCPYALVGKIYGSPTDPGYAYWSGTSFAAPLVSGLAACALASCGSNCSEFNATENVFDHIKSGAGPESTGTLFLTSPGRLISVCNTLGISCPTPTPTP